MSLVVVSLGGSIVNPGEIDVAFLKKFRRFVMDSPHRFVVVVGGGRPARQYMSAARVFTDRDVDWFGIEATWLNANLLWAVFQQSPKRVFAVPEKVRFRKVLCACGWKPGVSTDYDAVLWAELYNAKTVYNLTDIEYVYDRNPDKTGAKPLPKLSWSQYHDLVGPWKPGMHVPFDPKAAKRAEQKKICVVTMNGRKLVNVRRAMEGKSFVGTVIE